MLNVFSKDLKKAQRYQNNIFECGRVFFWTPPFWNAYEDKMLPCILQVAAPQPGAAWANLLIG